MRKKLLKKHIIMISVTVMLVCVAFILVLKASSTRLDVEWADVYGELPEGRYRIRKIVTDYVDDDDRTDYVLYEEFTVTDK